jgi:putative ABC transport system permease protein
MNKTLAFALRSLRRDWRSGELLLVFASLVVAVTSVTAVAMFTDRIQGAMEKQANALLAADLAIDSKDPISETFSTAAHSRGLTTANITTFRSVATAGERMQLVELKAVEDSYPLRGALQVAETLFGDPQTIANVPARGEAWVETRVLPALDINIGDQIQVGESALTITRVLVLEPDRGGDLFAIAPRLMMNLDDLAATGLVLPGSRVNYRLLLAGESADVKEYRTQMEATLPTGARFREARDARRELRSALRRAEQFLGLAVLTTILVASAAIAMAAQRYATRHLDNCAVLRCLGASQRFIVNIFAIEMLLLALLGGAVGIALGYLTQSGLAWLLRGIASAGLPPPGLLPLVTGMSISVIALMGFAMPPLFHLKDVPPGRVLRQDLGPPALASWRGRVNATVPIAAISLIVMLAPWRAHDLKLSAYLLGGCLVAMVVLAGTAWMLVKALGRLRGLVGVSWRYGLANISRRAHTSVIQVIAVGIGLMVMLVLALIRADLIAGWQASLPPRAPNHFLINVQPTEVEAVRAFFFERGIEAPDLYAMVRARFTHINDRPVSPEDYEDPRARRLADRDFNLSWTDKLKDDNTIVQGRWWPPAVPSNEFSVEREIAESLGFGVGDILGFRIAEQEIRAPVTSIREVNWDSFNVNFFVLAPPAWLEKFPATYITSFYLEDEHKLVLIDLIREFPSITVIDVAALMKQVRLVMDRVTLAVEYVFGFTLAAGLLVLIAALQATHDERMRESAILKTLGAGKARIRTGLLTEFCVIGALAGLLAAGIASLLSYALAEYVFNIVYQFNSLVWPLGIVAGILGTAVIGLLGMRSVLQQSPVEILRRA